MNYLKWPFRAKHERNGKCTYGKDEFSATGEGNGKLDLEVLCFRSQLMPVEPFKH
jgi:hypothetical protein